jgi:asparagine synthase (glutamine-hydrolysing)
VAEPLADPAILPTFLLARAAREHVKVILSGEGADELFGGYPTYLGVGAARAFARWPRPLRAAVRALVERWPHSERKVTVSFLLKRFLAGSDLSGLERHRLWTSSIAPNLVERLGLPAARSVDEDADAQTELLDLVQRYDLEHSLAEGLLTKADRASMNWALELRSPFLDREVMELAATLPVRERVRRLSTKVFLKRYAERYLPRSIVHRTKRGLSVPLSAWLRGPLAGWARGMLEARELESVGIRREAALELFDEHRARTQDHARALWTLIALAVWLEWNAGRASS